MKSDRQRTKELEGNRRLTVSAELCTLVGPVCHHGESSDSKQEDTSHEVSTDVEVVSLVVDPDGDTADGQSPPESAIMTHMKSV